MHYISNFVKSGDPTKPNQLQVQSPIEDRFHSTPWPQFNPASREAYLEITDRPRVKNYYRNNFVGFWSSFVPQLNKGPRDGSIPEEHHFLPDHFNKQSFFGSVRPYSALHNDPFPPPPLPPTPIPKNVKKPSTTQNPKSTPKPTLDPKELAEIELKYAKIHADKYSTMLIIIVVIGVVFLVLNIFVCIAAYRMVSLFVYMYIYMYLYMCINMQLCIIYIHFSVKIHEVTRKFRSISPTLPRAICLLLISTTFLIRPSASR